MASGGKEIYGCLCKGSDVMSLKIRGVNYDAGIDFHSGGLSREIWNEDDIRRDMMAIRTELHCNYVNIYGSNISRLMEAAKIAISVGLSVSIQPRLIDCTKVEMLDFIQRCAREGEKVRSNDNVILNIGCETSLFVKGFIPGISYHWRMQALYWVKYLKTRIDHKLNKYLEEAIQVARHEFKGKITYAAGVWENVDWSQFDLVGVNLFRNKDNEQSYLSELRKLNHYGKPVVITEFGCCTYEGAEQLGLLGWKIIDYYKNPPRIKGEFKRSEETQADLLSDLINIYDQENIYGAYVYEFIVPQQYYAENPMFDLDMASYGIVKVIQDSNNPDRIMWERKKAFYVVADWYSK